MADEEMREQPASSDNRPWRDVYDVVPPNNRVHVRTLASYLAALLAGDIAILQHERELNQTDEEAQAAIDQLLARRHELQRWAEGQGEEMVQIALHPCFPEQDWPREWESTNEGRTHIVFWRLQ